MHFPRDKKSRRAVIGVESAIVLIAFVIVAAALSFVILNMGFSTTQKAKTTISSGLETSSSALQIAGTVTGKGDVAASKLNSTAIPIEVASGSSGIDLQKSSTAVKYVSQSVSYDNIYNGTLSGTYSSLDDAVKAASNSTNMMLSFDSKNNPKNTVAFMYWSINKNDNTVAEPGEHLVLAIVYKVQTGADDRPASQSRFMAELIPTRGATLTVQREVPVVTDKIIDLT
jgi:flagellin FlaB